VVEQELKLWEKEQYDDLRLERELEALTLREATIAAERQDLEETRAMVLVRELTADVRDYDLNSREEELTDRKKQFVKREQQLVGRQLQELDSHDVEQQMLIGLQSYPYWQRCKVLVQLLECLICLLDPDKGSKLPQQLEEWESPLYQSRNKSAERGQASRELLDILDAGWWPHLLDCLDRLWVSLDSPVRNQEAEQLSSRDAEHTLVRVQHCAC
jgi:hypothetical protein